MNFNCVNGGLQISWLHILEPNLTKVAPDPTTPEELIVPPPFELGAPQKQLTTCSSMQCRIKTFRKHENSGAKTEMLINRLSE